MEEKKIKGLPGWILWTVNIIVALIIFAMALLLGKGVLSIAGLITFSLSTVMIATVCTAIDREEVIDSANDIIEDKDIQISTLEEENNELREVVKNFQKESRKNKKTKKNDDGQGKR